MCILNPRKVSFEEADRELALCDSYERLPKLLELEMWGWLETRDFVRLLGEWWSSCDNIGEYADDLWDTQAFMWWPFNGPMPEMMTAEELDAYNALPEMVTIYRGCYQINKWGWSWSLSKDVAKKFPFFLRYHRPGDQPLLVTAKAKKKNIIAVKLDRGESEIITWTPRHLSTHRIKVPEGNPLVIAD